MELDFIDISRPRSEQAPVRRRPAPRRRPVNRQAQRRAEQKRRAAYRRKRRLLKGVILLLEVCFIFLLCFLLYRLVRSFSGGEGFVQTLSNNREIIQCIPLQEIAYAVKGRNYDSVSIECCYLSPDGQFTDATYQSLLRLCAWLMKEYELTPDDLRRHYDEGGKLCPLYYAEHEEAWEQLKQDVEETILNTEAVFG